MNNNTEKKKGIGALYLILSLLAIAILCVTLMPFLGENAKKNRDDTTGTTSSDSTSITAAPDTKAVTKPPVTSDKTHESSTAETSAATVPSSAPLLFSQPCEGFAVKEFSDDMPVYSLTMNDYRVHLGVDILSEVGATVSACADGTVERIFNDPMMGCAITLDHGNGLKSHYFNLAEGVPDGIAEGMAVHRNQTIGQIGDTSLVELSDDPHLHFEMTDNGVYVDPLDYVVYEISVAAVFED